VPSVGATRSAGVGVGPCANARGPAHTISPAKSMLSPLDLLPISFHAFMTPILLGGLAPVLGPFIMVHSGMLVYDWTFKWLIDAVTGQVPTVPKLRGRTGISDLDLLLVRIVRFSCHRHNEIYN
jgi:hypothetical protein